METDHVLPEKQPFRQALPWVSFTSFIFLLTYLNRAMFGPLLGYIETEFAINHSQSTELLFYISIGYAISTFCSGITCSWVRPRTMVAFSVCFCGAILIAMSYTTHFGYFQILFGILGFAAGQYFNAGLSTLRSLVIPKDWGKTIAVHELGPNISFVLGPILIGFGASIFGWRSFVFYMGVFSCITGIAFLLKAKGGQFPPPPCSLKGVSRVLKKPELWLFAWLFGLGVAGEFAPFSVLTLFMESELHYSPQKSTFLLTTSRLLTPLAVIYGGYITSKFSTRNILMVCFGLTALGMLLMAIQWEPAFIAGIFIQPLATALSFPPIFTLLAESFSTEDQPMLLALTIPPAAALGSGVTPKILGYFGDASSFAHGFIALGIFCIGTVFLISWVVKSSATIKA